MKMNEFEEWAKSLPKWSDKLLELGASWDSFRREPDEVIADLLKGGIPLLSAKDIVDKAREALQRKSAPMAVFWDLETITLPTTSVGRDVTAKLKSVLSCYGTLALMRGYLSGTMASMSEKQRSDMIKSGLVLVDSPLGGKEVATKRIIVDAMKFAYDHPDTASICLITGDPDVTYLLSALERPYLSTILISNSGALKQMTDAICDFKLTWEIDILQQQSTASTKSAGRSSEYGAAVKDSAQTRHVNGSHESSAAIHASEKYPSRRLSMNEVDLLRTQIAAAAIDLGNGQKHSALKSRVGSLLRLADPQRFPTREDLTLFLSQSVEDGLVAESGYGEYKVLTMIGSENEPSLPPLEIKKQTPPLTNVDLPKKVIDLTRTRPYIIFVPWSECVNRETFPSKAVVHTSEKWAMLMFETLINAQQAAVGFPWLRSGDLIDWRRVGNDRFPSKHVSSTAAGRTESRYIKKAPYHSRNHEERDETVTAVVTVIEMLLKSDELYVAEPVLRYQLAAQRDGNTADKQYFFWIEKAVRVGSIILFRRPGVPKGRFYCLPNQLENSRAACNPNEIDTSDEEKHVVQLLSAASNNCVTRSEIIESLRKNFSRMESPAMRVRVFQNGGRKGLFFVAKDGSSQIVGQSKELAQEALKLSQSFSGSAATSQNGKGSSSDAV